MIYTTILNFRCVRGREGEQSIKNVYLVMKLTLILVPSSSPFLSSSNFPPRLAIDSRILFCSGNCFPKISQVVARDGMYTFLYEIAWSRYTRGLGYVPLNKGFSSLRVRNFHDNTQGKRSNTGNKEKRYAFML